MDRPTQEQWAATWPPLHRSGSELCGPCPVCGGEDRFHVRSNGAFGCRKCIDGRPTDERRRAKHEVLKAVGFFPNRNTQQTGRKSGADQRFPIEDRLQGRDSNSDRTSRMRRYARLLWGLSDPVPDDPKHPVRRWAALRRIWPTGKPWPSTIRWLPASTFLSNGRPVFQGHQGAGAIAAAICSLAVWWSMIDDDPPNTVDGLQLVSLDADGQPVLDKAESGLEKRSYGVLDGRCGWVPNTGNLAVEVHLVEGLADALAVATEDGVPVVACMGTSGLRASWQWDGWDSRPEGLKLERVLYRPDGDDAGRASATYAAQHLKDRISSLSVAWRELPYGIDPADQATVSERLGYRK